MDTRKLHYFSGWIISVFVALHLLNHLWSVFGADAHIGMMKALRPFYRNMFAEAVLLGAVLIQILSGGKLFKRSRKEAAGPFDKLHIWSGLYLAGFFVIHVGAVLSGRWLLRLDTNFHFGVAGLNTFPLRLFFIPYYGLAIISFFGHIASVHAKKMKGDILGLKPNSQATFILVLGFFLTLSIFYGLTNHFNGVMIPEPYKILVGK